MVWNREAWVDDDGSLTVGTPYTAGRMNNIESGIGDRPETVHDAISKPTAGTGNLTWTHTPVSEFIKGVLVGVIQNHRSKVPFGVSKVTYGGKEMTQVMVRAESEFATQAWYYLPTVKIPQGAQSVVVTAANTESKRTAFCATVTADGSVRPIFLQAAAPSASIAGRDITETLEQGAYYGMVSAVPQPTLSGSLTQAVLNENLGSEATPMWAAVSRSIKSHPGKGEGSGERPEVSWTLATKGAYGATIALMGLVKNWGERPTLPPRPGLGDTFAYQAASEIVWDLVYDNLNTTYPWRFVGDNSLYSEVVTTQSTASTSYTGLTTAGPKVTLPRPGIYDVEIGFIAVQAGGSGAVTGRMSYKIGAAAAQEEDRASVITPVSSSAANAARKRRKTFAEGNTELLAQYSVSGGTVEFFFRWMDAKPVRVG